MRKNRALYTTVMIITLLAAFIALNTSVFGGNVAERSMGDYEIIALGGLLYDNWYTVIGEQTAGDHPSYPAEGQKSGSTTWRCKECHGWDYMGSDGAYSGGSHFTGIRGIRKFAGKSPAVISDILKDNRHAFGERLSETAYEALSYFVAYGQTDTDMYIDRSTKKAIGNVNRGAKIYASTCRKCHGMDGKKINFKTPENPEYLGTVASKNPWETLHKIRFGQPSAEMVNLLFTDIRDQIDVLSFCQILPVK